MRNSFANPILRAMRLAFHLSQFFVFYPCFGQDSLVKKDQEFVIEEAEMTIDLPSGWDLAGVIGKLEQGKIQYNFSCENQVEGDGRNVNPSLIVTLDKGKWFSDQGNYVANKIEFHEVLDDVFEKQLEPNATDNPLQIAGYYLEGRSGIPESPFGQKLILVIFWNENFGFHLEIQTSEKDFEANQDTYLGIVSSLRSQQ